MLNQCSLKSGVTIALPSPVEQTSSLSNHVIMNNRLKDLYSKFLASQRIPLSVLNVLIYIRNAAFNTYWIFKRKNCKFYNHIKQHSKNTQRSVAPILHFPLVLKKFPLMFHITAGRSSKLMHQRHPASNLPIRGPFWHWISTVKSVRPQQCHSAHNFFQKHCQHQSHGSKTTEQHWIYILNKLKTSCTP